MPPEFVRPVNELLVPLLSTARVLVVAGKGGVGKTTVTATLTTAAVAAGMRVLAVELDGRPLLSQLLSPVGPPELVHPIEPSRALDDYLREHGFGKVASRLRSTGVIDVVATAAPGIDDIVVLGRIKQLERSGEWDLIVVDGPAAGHALTLLTSAAGLRNAVRSGPVRQQADQVLELLGDPQRCAVVLATLPETTPVIETVETAFALEDRVGVALGPIVVNAVDLPGDAVADAELTAAMAATDDAGLRAAAEFRLARRAVQRTALQRLAAELALPQVLLPFDPSIGRDPSAIERLAAGAVANPDVVGP